VLVSVLGLDGGTGLTSAFLQKGTTLFLPLVLVLVLTTAGVPELLLLLRSVPEGLCQRVCLHPAQAQAAASGAGTAAAAAAAAVGTACQMHLHEAVAMW
jgi:hypothetical protein